MKRMIDDVEGEEGDNNPDAKKVKIDKTASFTQQLTVSTIRVIIDTPDLPAKSRRVFLSSLPSEIITKICDYVYNRQMHNILFSNGRLTTRRGTHPLGTILSSKQFSSPGLRALYKNDLFVIGGIDAATRFCRGLPYGALDLITMLEVEQFAEEPDIAHYRFIWAQLGNELGYLTNLKRIHVYMLHHVGLELELRTIGALLHELQNQLYLRRLLNDNHARFDIDATLPLAWKTRKQSEQYTWLDNRMNYPGYRRVCFSGSCWVWQ